MGLERTEAEKMVADAIILERAARVLDRTSHREPFHFTAAHWIGVKDTLREVATAKRAEAQQGVQDAAKEARPVG